jgi:hypothetical protein
VKRFWENGVTKILSIAVLLDMLVTFTGCFIVLKLYFEVSIVYILETFYAFSFLKHLLQADSRTCSTNGSESCFLWRWYGSISKMPCCFLFPQCSYEGARWNLQVSKRFCLLSIPYVAKSYILHSWKYCLVLKFFIGIMTCYLEPLHQYTILWYTPSSLVYKKIFKKTLPLRK